MSSSTRRQQQERDNEYSGNTQQNSNSDILLSCNIYIYCG